MEAKELFEMYKNLDLKDKIKFDMLFIRNNEEEKLKQINKKLEINSELNNIIDEDDQPYFSSEFLKKLLK